MKELSTEERLAICDKCPMYKNGRCNPNLWINPNTDEVSTSAKPGYIHGCGCVSAVRAKNPNNHCHAGKW